MRLSSVYLYEKIQQQYEIQEKGNLSGSDGYLRPFLRCGISKEGKKSEDGFQTGHVYVIQGCDANECEPVNSKAENIFWIFCKRKDTVRAEENGETVGKGAYIQVALDSLEEIAEFMNDVQEIFDAADEWERKIHDLMLEHAGMDRLLQVTSEFLQNPMTVTGLDFTFVAEAGSEYLPPRKSMDI